MGTVVDHLQADHEVLVCQSFTDRRGAPVDVPDSAVYKWIRDQAIGLRYV